ncbi:MAG: sugar ABC transporter substrate-binding protein [Chloroflexota bacterium]|nr:sugar ABC transporter substrate-binding protein [Chloroflexota bacterium]
MTGHWNAKQSRRQLLRRGAGAAVAAPLTLGALRQHAAAIPLTQGTPTSDFNWKQFEGESINVLLSLSPRSDLLTQHQAEFEELTGITVNADVVPEQQQRQKQTIEFTSGNPSFDVTAVSWHVQKALFGRGQFMLDLREFLENPELTAPDYDLADFAPAAMTFATQADGRLDTLPYNIDYWILYWNKEIFEQKGVAFPTTFDEMVAAAKALHDPGNNVFGFAARGLKNANVPVWTSLMQGWEVPAIDAENQMHTTSEEAVAAATIYQDLLANYAPPGVIGFNWNECQTTFSQGTAAMWFDGIGFATPLEDPAGSLVVGKVGYGLQPAGPVAHHSGSFGDGLGVTSGSEKPEAAYFYCQWATNKQNQARVLAAGAGAPARTSAYSDPEALANLIVPQEWVDTLIASGEIGLPSLPQIVPVTEFRDIFGIALTNMITGADPRQELESATEQFQPILEQSLQS